jgi:hypothetical protein
MRRQDDIPCLYARREVVMIGDTVEHKSIICAIPVLVDQKGVLNGFFEAFGPRSSIYQCLEMGHSTEEQSFYRGCV